MVEAALRRQVPRAGPLARAPAGLQVRPQGPLELLQAVPRRVVRLQVEPRLAVAQERTEQGPAEPLPVVLWRAEVLERALPVRGLLLRLGSRQVSPAAVELRPESSWDSRQRLPVWLPRGEQPT